MLAHRVQKETLAFLDARENEEIRAREVLMAFKDHPDTMVKRETLESQGMIYISKRKIND